MPPSWTSTAEIFGIRSGWALMYAREPSRPCSSPLQSMNRIVRRGLTPAFIRMRAASSVVAQPVPLSVVPGGPVPGVDVAADDHVLVGELGAGDVGDHVVERDRALLEVVADVELEDDRLALLDQPGDLVELRP